MTGQDQQFLARGSRRRAILLGSGALLKAKYVPFPGVAKGCFERIERPRVTLTPGAGEP